MSLKIRHKSIIDFLLSFLFYIQLLGINVFSSYYIWIPNIVLLILISFYLTSILRLKINKLSLFFIFLFYWIITDILLFFLDFSIIGYSELAVGNFLLITFQLPVLSLIIYYLFSDDYSLKIFSRVSFFVSLFIYLLWYFQIIEDFKYQIIGNISLFTIILFQNKYFLNNKNYLNAFIQLILIIIIITVGSRQSFIGLLIFFLILLCHQSLTKSISYLLIFLAFSSIFYFTFLNKIIIDDNFLFNTINRFSANLDLESTSNSYRIESAENLIRNFSLLPNGYLYTSDYYFLEPHNLFLEIVYLKGYLLGGFLVIIILILLINAMLFYNNRFLRFLILVLLVPAMVSYSLHAARFFIIGILLLLIYMSNFQNKNKIIDRNS